MAFGKLPFLTRVRHAWAVLCGRVQLPLTPEHMELLQAMSNLDDAIARLQTASARAITKGQNDSQLASNAQQAAADLETATVAKLDAVSADLEAYAPAPVISSADGTAAAGATA